MKTARRKKLEQAGWRVGTAAEFLELTPDEEIIVNMKVALAAEIKALRERQNVSQVELAKRIGSSQSRIAKAEAADGSVSLELLVRSLVSLGASQQEIGRVIGSAS